MKCERCCKHGKCSKLCGENCDRPPCSEPCPLVLKCNHPCRGICGELCPPICKYCDPKSVPEIFFGNEEDEDATFVKLVDCQHSVEVKSLDSWVMDMTPNESHKISIRPCPYCNTPIVNTPRYLDLVRKSLFQIGKVKTQLFGNAKTIDTKLVTLRQDFQELKNRSKVMEKVSKWRYLIGEIEIVINKVPKKLPKNRKAKFEMSISIQDVNKYSAVVNILGRIAALCFKSEEVISSHLVMFQIKNLINCIAMTGTSISLQQCEDFTNELLRTERLIQVIKLEVAFKTGIKTGKDGDMESSFAIINDILLSTQIYTDSLDCVIKDEMEKLKKCVDVTLTAVERKQIITAIGLKQGHWYACPNGHYYCIGECGGAMEVGVCPECKAQIGGTQHRLINDNRLAPEMDGASHSAWSEAAHMNNYDLAGL